ncbi:MAG TPA: ankyrin repeat domain-containing protein [Terriglobia bacterium]|nr:ankyrin repeat domain-containing protein [Terriglobia bacterium]
MSVHRSQPPTRRMRENPDLDQLKRQARELLKAYRKQTPEAVAEVNAYHRAASPDTFALHDAQFVLARSYGFESWPRLKAAVDGITAAKLHEAVEKGDVAAARALLERRPEIVDAGPDEKRALHIAVMRRDLPMTRLLLEFHAHPENGIYPRRDATGPFVMARDRGYTEIADLLHEARLQRGFSPETVSVEARRKLGQAYRSGGEDAMVAVFDEHPELADMRPIDGPSMLHQAAGHGALKVLQWMIDRGRDVNEKWRRPWWNHEWTPLDFAASAQASIGQLDYARFQATADLLLKNGARLTPLAAATLGRWDYLQTCSKEELEGQCVLEGAVRGNHLDIVRSLLDLGLDPDERFQVGAVAEQAWAAAGPLWQAVVLDRIEIARLLLERGANPNLDHWAAGSPAFRVYDRRNPEMIALIEKYGGWIDAGGAGYARQVEMARKMLSGELDGHVTPNDFSGHTVAEQLLWGGSSSLCVEIVRMALEHVDWTPDNPRWFGMLLRPMHSHGDYDEQQQAECIESYRLILARSGPDHRDRRFGQTILHEIVAWGQVAGLTLAAMTLDAGARLDVRDDLLRSTPLGWACRWGRAALVKLFLDRGADPVEPDTEPWATPRAWAERERHAEIPELLDQADNRPPSP